MNKKMIRRIVVSLLVVVGLFFAVRQIRIDHYPLPIKPSAEWEPYVSSLDAEREAFFVDSDGVMLEAELFIPNGGAEQKAAVVFAPGSGDSLYQNYSWGFVETNILDVFLARDMAVLLVNKRGMGQSEGNYVKNSIEGRAEDLYAAVQSIQSHLRIDADNIGLIGHSQGGWVVVQAAGAHPDIAFFISLAGPTMIVEEQMADMYMHAALCEGLTGEEADAFVEKNMKKTELGVKLGELTNFGMWGFDARVRNYNPADSLLAVESPGLYVFGGNDNLVTPALNIERMEEIFDDNVPDNLSTAVVAGATHVFRLVDDTCDSWVNPAEQEPAAELVQVLNGWLESIGY